MVTEPATTVLSALITATVAKGNGSLFDLSTTVPRSTVWAESAMEMLTNRSMNTYFFIGFIFIFVTFYSSTVSSRKLTGRKPSLQLIMALWGFFIQPS